MTRPISTIPAYLLALLLAAAAWGAELSITIAGMENTNGQLMIAVLDGEDAFAANRPPVLSMLLPPKKGALTISTDALPPGEYAVRVVQDENGNGTLDTNMVGMPREPWGFSNNAVGSFAPPPWEAVRFRLDSDLAITVDLNH